MSLGPKVVASSLKPGKPLRNGPRQPPIDPAKKPCYFGDIGELGYYRLSSVSGAPTRSKSGQCCGGRGSPAVLCREFLAGCLNDFLLGCN